MHYFTTILTIITVFVFFEFCKGILTFSMYIFHFIAGRKKNACNLQQSSNSYLSLIAATYRFCERACIILTNEKQQ